MHLVRHTDLAVRWHSIKTISLVAGLQVEDKIFRESRLMKPIRQYRTSALEHFQGLPLELAFRTQIEAHVHRAEHSSAEDEQEMTTTTTTTNAVAPPANLISRLAAL